MKAFPEVAPPCNRLDRSVLRSLPAGLTAPRFEVDRVVPGIVHLGVGGFHRAHMARYTHDLMDLDDSSLEWGIVGAGLRSNDRPLLTALADQQGLYTLVERDTDGEQATVIGSISRVIDASVSSDTLLNAIDDASVRIVSLTVTEHGYCLDRATKTLDLDSPAITHDLAHPHEPASAIGILVEAYARRLTGKLPAFTALSCDNIQHNGNVLKEAVLSFARLRDPVLAAWIKSEAVFPNTMVDRITPIPSEEQIAAFQAKTGIADRAPLLAEPYRQWVIEDRFVSGRPAWEKVGAQFVDDVAPYEFMKLRLLNTSHLVIAGLGQLAGYDLIDQALGDPLIRRTMQSLMDRETGPTLPAVPGIDLEAYKAELIRRFANSAIRDTVARVNADAPINLLLDPIRDRLEANEPIDVLALGLAAWLRRVRGEDEVGRRWPVHHPLAAELRARAIEGNSDPRPLLSIRELFGDLGKDPRLTSSVGRWLANLYHVGTKQTLRIAEKSTII